MGHTVVAFLKYHKSIKHRSTKTLAKTPKSIQNMKFSSNHNCAVVNTLITQEITASEKVKSRD